MLHALRNIILTLIALGLLAASLQQPDPFIARAEQVIALSAFAMAWLISRI